jgi:quercetin dioxygenase-like cupin family protein
MALIKRRKTMCFTDWDKIQAEDVSWRYRRKVARGDNLAVAMVEVLKGATTRPHRHENEEVILVLKGSWRFHLRGEEVTLGANQMLSIPPGVEHSSVVLEDTTAVDICTTARPDWSTGEDRALHYDPEQYLWAV